MKTALGKRALGRTISYGDSHPLVAVFAEWVDLAGLSLGREVEGVVEGYRSARRVADRHVADRRFVDATEDEKSVVDPEEQAFDHAKQQPTGKGKYPRTATTRAPSPARNARRSRESIPVRGRWQLVVGHLGGNPSGQLVLPKEKGVPSI